MNKTVNVIWNSGMQFIGKVDDFSIVLDASDEVGGKNSGPRPKSLLMISLGGCTGMDVVSLLKKMKVNFSFFNIKLTGTLAEEHPMSYENIHIIYEIICSKDDLAKVEKAVQLSMNKYCGVSATLKKGIPVTYEIQLNPE